jgi:protein phosphatase methylesterase 1
MVYISSLTVVVFLLIVRINCEECGCDKIPSIEIINDEQLANGIEEVRNEFLSKQPASNFDRLTATILIRENNTQTWKRGSVNGTQIDYPASTVKLFYMYSAMDWCKKQGLAIDCLSRYVRPMVIISSNLDTGYVVDAITNTTNIYDLNSVNDSRWSDWRYQRLSTERLLVELNLYENQIIRSKTYPTNSGQSPVGSESILLRPPGQRNMLQSCCTASFMLYLMQTRPKNELDYMKSLIYRTLVNDQTTFGNGLPAGTILYSKSGNAYDTVEEIAYIILPNGKEIILSAFSNGFKRPASDFYILGRFAEMVINKFTLNSPSTKIFTTDDPDIYTCDNVNKQTSSLPKDTIGQSLITFNNSCIIHPTLSERGVYTVSIWNPSIFDSTTSNYRLNVAVTDANNDTEGDDGYMYDQQVRASSWISVGDFLLNPGHQNVYLKSLNEKSVFNAIRFSMHPPLTIDSTPNTNSKSSILIPFHTLINFILLFFLITSIVN